ncbi:hypothetical protein F2P46_29185 [Massilia sp. CCM 8734]|nr:hypothetical protein [Massilia sp. CCM 8734]
MGISVYEWAIENGQFSAKNEQQKSSAFIQKFSSAAQEHVHFESGIAEQSAIKIIIYFSGLEETVASGISFV